MAMPITTIKASPLYLAPSVPATSINTVQFIDLGDAYVINGMLYSPDLKSIYGAWEDPTSKVSASVRAAKVAGNLGTSVTTIGSVPRTNPWGNYLWAPNFGRLPSYASNGYKIIAMDGMPTNFSPPLWINRDGINRNQYSTTVSNNQQLVEIVESGGNTIVFGATGLNPGYGAAYVYDNTGKFINQNISNGYMYGTTSAYPTWTRVVQMSDGWLVVGGHTMRTDAIKWGLAGISLSGTGWVNIGGASLPRGTTAYQRVVAQVAPVGVGLFYILEMSPAAADRVIRYCNVPNLASMQSGSATPFTHTVCTGDFTPLQYWSYTATNAELDLVTRINKVTVDGSDYLLIAVHSMLQTAEAGFNVQSKLIAYRIDPVTPTNLTLVADQLVTRSSISLHDGATILMGRAGTVEKWVFDGTSFTMVTSYTVDNYITWLVKTEAGRYIGISSYSNMVYDLTTSTTYRPVCSFQALSEVSTGVDQNVVVNVDVYDAASARVAVPVNLTVTGGKFSNGTTSLQVTSSASATVPINVTVKDPALVKVIPTLA